ncbi:MULTISPECIES: hypothetical protein [Streptomyces]|uniref:Uncharacterized protein n=1 Tax=Streptomyces stelliscabiei TaxID=146820 RepID=A0A8I0TVA7_9ACTN|nr:hypothetical protein [Streptomyces stelliscabiei]
MGSFDESNRLVGVSLVLLLRPLPKPKRYFAYLSGAGGEAVEVTDPAVAVQRAATLRPNAATGHTDTRLRLVAVSRHQLRLGGYEIPRNLCKGRVDQCGRRDLRQVAAVVTARVRG